MKVKSWGIILAILAVVALFAGYMRPLSLDLFVLKGGPEAFRVKVSLNGKDSSVESLNLKTDLQKEADEILDARDPGRLTQLAGKFGVFQGVVGMPKGGEEWPGFLRGRFGAKEEDEGEFDDLVFLDRLYLTVASPVLSPELTPVKTEEPVPTAVPNGPQTVPAAATTPPATAVLRVEILNGCGITGAAEAVVRRLKDLDVQVVATGNAQNFHYPKTLVQSSLSGSVALQEIMEKLALSSDRLQEPESAQAGADAIIIIGRDYRKLRGAWRERDRHRPQ